MTPKGADLRAVPLEQEVAIEQLGVDRCSRCQDHRWLYTWPGRAERVCGACIMTKAVLYRMFPDRELSAETDRERAAS